MASHDARSDMGRYAALKGRRAEAHVTAIRLVVFLHRSVEVPPSAPIGLFNYLITLCLSCGFGVLERFPHPFDRLGAVPQPLSQRARGAANGSRYGLAPYSTCATQWNISKPAANGSRYGLAPYSTCATQWSVSKPATNGSRYGLAPYSTRVTPRVGLVETRPHPSTRFRQAQHKLNVPALCGASAP